MKNLKKHVKILSALSLASSDTREDTFLSVIIRTLYEINRCKKSELSGYIQEQFGFEPYKSELEQIVSKLLESGIILDKEGNIYLSEDEKRRIDSQDLTIKDKDKARFQNFKNFILYELKVEVQPKELAKLWSVFLEYMYNSFFEYGEDALRTLHPHISNSDGNGIYENILTETLEKLTPQKQKKLFKRIIESFPDFASQEDIDFLNELAQKTLSFSSLGFEPEIAAETIEHDLIDWVLYLDTNVLYSLLDLHAHPENESCKALVKLINDNSEHLKIKIRYSDITYKELVYKKDDFSLLDDKLSDKAIRAMLKSGKLDGFAEQFYKKLLDHRESTIHPTSVIEFSQSTLDRLGIKIGRNGKRIEHLGEDYLNAKVGDFFAFLNKKNDARLLYCKERNIPEVRLIQKSDKQAYHDITLRELMLDQRSKAKKGIELSLNSVKFFAVTLDGLLIGFDRNQLGNYHDERSFPVFFKPSFLLNRLVRILPIKTDDYKKAFIKAVTSRGFNKETEKSRDVLKIVNYLKSQGIDDERVVYNIINQDNFLEKFHKKQEDSSFNQGEFIESEINRELREIQEKLTKTEEQLIKTNEIAGVTENENKKLNERKTNLEDEKNHYLKAIEQLQSRVNELENQQPPHEKQATMNFEAEEAKADVKKEKEKTRKLKSKLKNNIEEKINSEKRQALKKWQRKVWWNLIWVIPSGLAALFFILPFDQNPITEESVRFQTGTIIMTPVILVFLWLIQMRYWNEGNKKSKLENHVISDQLIKELNEIKSDSE